MAEVHILGQVTAARDFEENSLFCKWLINTGPLWEILEGHNEGQTQLSTSSVNRNIHYWSHPIDIHYTTRGLQGWPKFELQIWGVDWLGKANISGYGFMNIPTQPGPHKLECSTWMPVGNFRQRFMNYMTGQKMHLVDQSDIVSKGLGRHNIQAQSVGDVQIELNVILRDFEKYGVEIDEHRYYIDAQSPQ